MGRIEDQFAIWAPRFPLPIRDGWPEFCRNVGDMRWEGDWTQQEYKEGAVVLDGFWLMIANKDTNDRPSPQPIGSPEWLLPDSPTWVSRQVSGYVWTGLQINLQEEGLYAVSSIRAWIPDVSPDARYRIAVYDNLTGVWDFGQEFSGDILSAPGWVEFPRESVFITDSDNVTVFLFSENSSTTTNYDHPWGRGSNSQNSPPDDGDWNTNNQGTILRITYLDHNGVDRSGVLSQVIPGTSITLTEQTDPNSWIKVDVATSYDEVLGYYEMGITLNDTGPNGAPSIGAICDLFFEIPVAALTNYVELTDEYVSDPSLNGFLAENSIPPLGLVNQNAYGIDVFYREYATSPDWDFLAYSGGSGGGGGISTFLGLTDTPSSYPAPDMVPLINSALNALEFGYRLPGNANLPVAGASTPANDYQEGLTIMNVTNGIANGWPAEGGTVATFKHTTDTRRVFQLFAQQGGNSLQYRAVDGSANWTSWQELITGPAIATISTLSDSATLTGAGWHTVLDHAPGMSLMLSTLRKTSIPPADIEFKATRDGVLIYHDTVSVPAGIHDIIGGDVESLRPTPVFARGHILVEARNVGPGPDPVLEAFGSTLGD